MRSICAGVAPVKGVLGSLDIESYKSWYTPNAKLIPHPVNTREVEAIKITIGCLVVNQIVSTSWDVHIGETRSTHMRSDRVN